MVSLELCNFAIVEKKVAIDNTLTSRCGYVLIKFDLKKKAYWNWPTSHSFQNPLVMGNLEKF